MTEKQEMKLQLLDKFANIEKPETVDFCRKAYEFLAEGETTPQPQAGAVVATDQKPDGIYLVLDVGKRDGIYLVLDGGKRVLFTGDNNADDCAACIGIGVKWGSRAIVVALNDQADGEDITLTANKDKGDYAGYIDNYLDAVADWNGKANTEHLKKIGLNQNITLPDGWYIPSLGELYFVFLNRKAINAALEYVGGKTIDDYWYWTSTESSATYAWYLGLGNGGANYGAKASYTYRVRAVSAFIS